MINFSLNEVQYLAHVLAQQRYGFDEPIPDFSTRFPNMLESCLAVPFQTFSKKELYPTLINKASILFYLMIKNHPFQNGNKRVAVATLLVFLAKHKKWVKVGVKTLYNFAVAVAESDPKEKERMLKYIANFMETFIIAY
ncbi:type II toxin-antitoxin system death-on-curing family toxin [Candidatus Omnitrophota bacterium]